jgi:CheY-like chemotaxis protein
MFGIKRSSVKDLELKLPFDEIRRRARILVIDDNEKAFPVELLRKEGYNVEYWQTIAKLKDLAPGEYDVIVLDIVGVAQSLSEEDGLGVLEYLKKTNPAQLVIAYSGKKYDLSQGKFWRLADDFLGKPSDLLTCKDKIDSLLKAYFTPLRYWTEIERILKDTGISDSHLKKMERTMLSGITKGKAPPPRVISSYVTIGEDSLEIVNVLLKIIVKFFIPLPNP